MKLVIFKKGQTDTECKTLGLLANEENVVDLVAGYLFTKYPELDEIEFPTVLNANNICDEEINPDKLILKIGDSKITCQVMLANIQGPNYYYWSKNPPNPVFKPPNTDVFAWKKKDIKSLYRILEKLKKETPPDSGLD